MKTSKKTYYNLKLNDIELSNLARVMLEYLKNFYKEAEETDIYTERMLEEIFKIGNFPALEDINRKYKRYKGETNEN